MVTTANIEIVVKDVLYAYNWQKFCELKGLNVQCVAHGKVDLNETYALTLEEAEKVGIHLNGEFYTSSY